MAESPEDKIKNLRALNAEYARRIENSKTINDSEAQSRAISQELLANQKLINELIIEQGDNVEQNAAEIDALLKREKELLATQKAINDQLQQQIKRRQTVLDLAKQLTGQLKLGWKYLQDQDKIIKTTVLNLGMSGAKAVAMRDAFEKSAGYVTRLGGTIADIQGVMQGYADETGRARVMSAEMVKDITAIGKGTGLGIEQATRLGAQFELMGYDAKGTMDYVQGVVDTSERMGVNTTKVLKNVSDNFKKLNTYTFQQGVKGFAQMAMYAEKFKIDINQALNAVDIARTLEGAIDLAAQLQIMGGEFAKTDPFEMLFLSRNDPAKFTEKIADMTKGVVSFRKVTDSAGKTVFEKFISPADRDRLAAVAKSMGMEASELTVIAERQAEIQKMRQQTAGMGLSKQQQDLIEGAAIFDQKSGKFQVQLGQTMLNISELTDAQASSFVKEQVMLEERAKQAMTFSETFKATIEILKASLLPLLKSINGILEVTVKPLADLAAKGGWGLAGAAGILLTAGALWKGITWKLGDVAKQWASGGGIKGTLGKIGGGGKGAAASAAGGGGIAAGEIGSDFTKTGQIRKGASGLHKAKGLESLGKGGAVGAAAVGMGAGVALAAVGISKLADSMKELTPEQAKSLQMIAMTLAVTFPLAAIGIMLAGSAATATAPGLLALGAAMLMIGGAVGIAALGIGFMAKGFAEMFTALKDVDNLTEAAAGMAGIVAVLAAGTITLPAAIGLSLAIGRIGKHADNLVKVGAAFEQIKLSLSGSKDDFVAVKEAVESISNMNTKGGGMLADLARLLRKPLQVEFAKSGMVLRNDITLEIDKSTFMHKIYDPKIAVQMQESLRRGYGN